ncbi:MAG: metal-dependent phosphohydrolase [Syntrophus sp. (in: bacteria)]|nr:metal-dependent phosphohydrolase [Syntrophus sp. (in: bacteria)]
MTIPATSQAILHRPGKGRIFIVIASALLTGILVFLYMYQPVFFRFLDSKSYDTLLMAIPQERAITSETPVIIDIDDKSLSIYGQWPWPRYRVALLLEKLMELEPSSIGLDTVLAEPDRTSFAVLQKEIYRDLKINVPTRHIPSALLDNDKTLSATLARGPFVLGYKFTFSDKKISTDRCLLHPLNVAVITDAGRPPGLDHQLFQARDVICNLRTLAENAAFSGFFNATPDMDGVLRRIPLIVEYDGNKYPSLALATLIQAKGTKQVFLKIARGGVEHLRLNNTVVPLDGKGNLLIRYRGKSRTFDYISAADVLDGLVLKKQLQNRIVFLGTSAAGIGDFHATPLDNVFPGVEVHATVVDNILRKDFFSRPSWIPGVELMLVIAAGFFSAILLIWTGAFWNLLFLCLGALGLWQCSLWALHDAGIFISPVVPLIALGSNFTFVTLLKYWREERQKKARAKELLLTQDFTIRCLASLTECRDSETGGHILRTQAYVAAVCRQLSTDPRYAGALDEETREHLYKSSPLHDIGKVGVPDHILLKPDKLTPEEFEEMKKHTTYGRDAIQRAEEKFGMGKSSEFLRLAKEIAYTHHEKWDGSGYPKKLKGEEIPLSGRIMALADVYDALICHRVYKPPFTHDESVDLIVQLNGILFDPGVVAAFLEGQEEFRKIAIELADHDVHHEALEMDSAH